MSFSVFGFVAGLNCFLIFQLEITTTNSKGIWLYTDFRLPMLPYLPQIGGVVLFLTDNNNTLG